MDADRILSRAFLEGTARRARGPTCLRTESVLF